MVLRPLHEQLIASNIDLYEACADGAFVSGMADGSLPEATFAAYLRQDALFIREFLAATGLAVKTCASHPALVQALGDLIVGGVLELASIEGDAVAFGVDLNRMDPTSATTSFAEFLKSHVTDEVDVCVATLSPCLELYSYIGRTAQERGRVTANQEAYRKWFAKYASPGMQNLATMWRKNLDVFGSESPAAADAYRGALRWESTFFQSFLGQS
jgi:thiaminase/transcriptional activator TenA